MKAPIPHHHDTIEQVPIAALQRRSTNARAHPAKQIRQIVESIRRFGFTNPVLVDEANVILAGHGRVEAAKRLGLKTVPVRRLAFADEASVRAYVLADNKVALNAGWDLEVLALEFQELTDLGIDLGVTGFSIDEIDVTLDAAQKSKPDAKDDRLDAFEVSVGAPVSRPGDIFRLGRHKLLCGDALEYETYVALLGKEKVDMTFTDPPYNVAIEGNVSGRGQVKHSDFAMASGEMSPREFTEFLTHAMVLAGCYSRDGALAYVFMDWRHLRELTEAARPIFGEPINLCIWKKPNPGLGMFYRSQHELVLVYKNGSAPHISTLGLHDGRNRSNVWEYKGVSSGGADRQDALNMHPTVKPVQLVADAIQDCTKRGDIVLDPFGGSGSTLIAAQTCGRSARLIELDPHYCDTIVRRYQRLTGKPAVSVLGRNFDDLEQDRITP